MSDLVDIRTELAASRSTRVEIGRDGILHVLVGPVTLHLDQPTGEELTTTLARALLTLARQKRNRRQPALSLVQDGARAARKPRTSA